MAGGVDHLGIGLVGAGKLHQAHRFFVFIDAADAVAPALRVGQQTFAGVGLCLNLRTFNSQPAEQAGPGRAVGRLDGLGWSVALRELLEPSAGRPPGDQAHGGHDGELPVALRGAVEQVLGDQLAALREAGTTVEGVLAVGSTTRPTLLAHLARGVAHLAQVPLLGAVTAHDASPGRHDVNSATRLAAVARRLRLEEPNAAAVTGRALLLVDDYTDSGWTLTVAARLARQAGATAVHPFVLAQR